MGKIVGLSIVKAMGKGGIAKAICGWYGQGNVGLGVVGERVKVGITGVI